MNSYKHSAEVVSLFEDTIDVCLDVWTPVTDEKEEGTFRGLYTDEPVEFLPWHASMPTGAIGKNHVFFTFDYRTYTSTTKSRKACTICDVPVNASFTLLGFCKETLLGTLLHRIHKAHLFFRQEILADQQT